MTVTTYRASLTAFFTFLRANRAAFAHDPVVSKITEADVRAYFSYLKEERRATLATTNKVLSHLNRYFRYLFTHQLITAYPTLTLHGALAKPAPRVGQAWLGKLDELLASDQLHFYSRLVLFLSARGFTSNEFLAPDFGRILAREAPRSAAEERFLAAFTAFHAPLAARQNCEDPFLKVRVNRDHPHLTSAGLHKYLTPDEQLVGFSLSPRDLHQGFVLNQLRHHRDWSDQQLEQGLRLDPASLLYYRRLLLNADH